MTAHQAIELSTNEDKKMSHRYFGDEEWVKFLKSGKVETEEGYIVSATEFWFFRSGDDWQKDWDIFE